jgi:hypothetical protein
MRMLVFVGEETPGRGSSVDSRIRGRVKVVVNGDGRVSIALHGYVQTNNSTRGAAMQRGGRGGG